MPRVTPLLLAGLLAATATLATLADQPGQPPDAIKQAEQSFQAGYFAEALESYEAAWKRDPTNGQVALRLGEIALLANRLTDAEKYLKRAQELLPKENRPKALLGETYYRQDDFEQAAPLFRAIDRQGLAAKLESFQGQTPYQVVGAAAATRVKLAQTDPLPVLPVQVDGGETVHFLIDTGAPELVLGPDFAAEIGVVRFGSETAIFAGGKTGSYEHGRVDSLRIGDFEIRNVPVHISDRPMPPSLTGRHRLVGIVGAVLFYHFVTTLDYPNGELILERPTDEALARVEWRARSPRNHVVPFWMAGDHYIVGWGRANRADPCLMLIDTGLAGASFTCPASTLKAAQVELKEPPFFGIGGAGMVETRPFTLDELSLGTARQTNVRSFFGPFPPKGEHRWGFRVGGIVSQGFFRSYAVTFDFARMRLVLDPRE